MHGMPPLKMYAYLYRIIKTIFMRFFLTYMYSGPPIWGGGGKMAEMGGGGQNGREGKGPGTSPSGWAGAMKGKNVWNIGKPPAPNSVPYVPQYIDGRPAM